VNLVGTRDTVVKTPLFCAGKYLCKCLCRCVFRSLQRICNGSQDRFLLSSLQISGGHSLCHSGNGIREWSENRCVFAIPREFPFSFPFPQNSLEGGGHGGGQTAALSIFRSQVKSMGKYFSCISSFVSGHSLRNPYTS